jgi:hypothetical protein
MLSSDRPIRFREDIQLLACSVGGNELIPPVSEFCHDYIQPMRRIQEEPCMIDVISTATVRVPFFQEFKIEKVNFFQKIHFFFRAKQNCNILWELNAREHYCTFYTSLHLSLRAGRKSREEKITQRKSRGEKITRQKSRNTTIPHAKITRGENHATYCINILN